MKKFALVIALGLLAGQLRLEAATLPPGFTETALATVPNLTAMEIAPDGRIFVCQQTGDLRVIKNGALLPTPFVSLAVNSSGERGLLGVAFDPNFAANNFVYAYYTTSSAPVHNRISRFIANGDVVVAGSEVILMDLDNLSSATNHNGGAIHFGPDGKLYVAVGENANPANAQSLANRLGKMLRINSDGTIPIDNPATFPGLAGSPSGQNRAIWAVGLRNPFTFAFQPGTGRMFINDVGQSAWEEINDGLTGSNYGWSICEGFCSPPNANYRDPIYQYSHTTGTPTGCAIVGAAFYNPSVNQFPNSYVGKYFFGDLCSGFIRVLNPTDNTSVPFATGVSSLVDLKVASDGSIYYLARGGGGQVFKVQFPNALVLQSAVSRKTHGGAGTFDIPLPLTGEPGVECRSTGGAFTLVFTFSNSVVSGSASVTAGTGSVAGSPTFSANTMTVNLAGVADVQKLTVILNSVTDAFAQVLPDTTVSVNLLIGDINSSKAVNASDVGIVKAQSGVPLDATSFRSDVAVSGAINASDVGLVKSRSGQSVP